MRSFVQNCPLPLAEDPNCCEPVGSAQIRTGHVVSGFDSGLLNFYGWLQCANSEAI
jgi:hypothetical protein